MKGTTEFPTKPRMYSKGVLLSLLIIGLAACATSMRTIKDTSERFYKPGFSILPPQEAGWQVNERFRRKLIFLKKGVEPKSSYVLEALSSGHSLSFESEKEYKLVMGKFVIAATVMPQRNELLEKKVSLAPKAGKFCLKTYSKMKDFGANNRGNEPYLLIEAFGLTCLHPDDKSQLVNLGFSYRYPPGSNDKALKAKAEKIMTGLQFEPLLKVRSQ